MFKCIDLMTSENETVVQKLSAYKDFLPK